jgi:hypothetical protein
MKNNYTYYWICLVIAIVLSFPAKAQVASPSETNSHADMVMRKEHHRERRRAEKSEKRAAKAEKRIEKKAQYKSRTKGKVKGERAPRAERRKRARSRD